MCGDRLMTKVELYSNIWLAAKSKKTFQS